MGSSPPAVDVAGDVAGAPPAEPPGEREIRWMGDWLVEPGGPRMGQPFQLLPHEVRFLRLAFGPGVRTAILSTPKKNRKTTLCAAIVLCYLCGPRARPGTSAFSTALALDQAALIFDEAVKLMSPEIAARVDRTDSRKLLHYPRLHTRYRALSADDKTKQGLGGRLAVHDELGEVEGPDAPLFRNVETGMVGHADPLSVIISTQAANDTDVLSRLIDAQLEAEEEAARSGVPPPTRTVLQIHQADDDAALEDERQWEQANPALGIIVQREALRDALARAQVLPEERATFRRYHLNLRTPAGEGAARRWFSREAWDLGNGPDGAEGPTETVGEPEEEAGNVLPRVWGGIDLSETVDLTAVTWAWRAEAGGPIRLKLRAWLPDHNLAGRAKEERIPWDTWAEAGLVTLCKGRTIDFEAVADEILTAWNVWDLGGLVYDPWRFAALKRLLTGTLGEDWIEEYARELRQGFKSMAPAMNDFENALLSGGLRHGDNPVLRMAAEQVRVTRDEAGNRKPTRRLVHHPIDPIVAAVMAVAGVLAGDEDEAGEIDGPLVSFS